MLRTLTLVSVTLAACSSPPAPPPPPAARTARAPVHRLIAVELGAGEPRVLASREVHGPLPVDRAPTGDWTVEVAAEDGALLYAAAVRAAGVVRGEFQDPGGGIEHVRFEGGPAVVTLRVPQLPRAARLRLWRPSATHGPSFAAKPGAPRALVAELPFPGSSR